MSESRKSKIIRLSIVVLSFIMAVSLVLMLVNMLSDKFNKPLKGKELEIGLKKTLTDGVNTYTLKEDISTFLVLGLDKFNEQIVDGETYYNDRQCDFLLLLVIDSEEGKVNAIQINRDTMTDVSVLGVAGQKVRTVKEQIALSHTYGNGELVSCRNSADAVSKLLKGAHIDHFLSITMDAVPLLNDQVGGVEVEIKDDFSAVDESLVKGTKVTLTGSQALTFVRARHEMQEPTNLARMERQRVYLSALFEKLRAYTRDSEQFAAETVTLLADYFTSNCTSAQLENIFTNISGYEFGKVYTLEGEAKAGEEFMEFYPDNASIERTVIELFYDKVD